MTLKPKPSSRVVAPLFAIGWLGLMIAGLIGPYPLPSAGLFFILGLPLFASVAQSLASYELTSDGIVRTAPTGTQTLTFEDINRILLKKGRAGMRTVTVRGKRGKFYFDNGRAGFDAFVSAMTGAAIDRGVAVKTGVLSGKIEEWV